MIDVARGLAAFASRAGRLKFTPRTGWIDRQIRDNDVESVADHSFRVALLAWVLSADVEGIDQARAIKLALLHDLAESLTGDQTPHDREVLAALGSEARRALLNTWQRKPAERRAAKTAAESRAIAEMTATLPAQIRAEILSLWDELVARTSPEARFVKEIDILETYLQSREYLASYPDLPVGSFAAEVETEIDTPFLQALRDAIASGLPKYDADDANQRLAVEETNSR